MLEPRKLRIFLSLLVVLSGLNACVSTDLSEWPESIPPQEIFTEAYQADEANQKLQSRAEYLEWVVSFYQGTLMYQSGWSDVVAIVKNAFPQQYQAELDTQLGRLGVTIGAEWAKHNDVRLIDNRMLSLWGTTLQLAMDPEQQQFSIDVISKDIDSLHQGRLRKSDISASRYEELLQIDLFDDF